MRRADLEHLLRAAGAIVDEEDIVVIGSQAILASFPEAPAELLVSLEADLFPQHAPQKSDVIDGAIGERSPFHDTFGYYAHGVGPETAVLPYRWFSRCVKIEGPATRGVRGWCLSPEDLAISKLVAGRPKDLSFVAVARQAGLLRAEVVLELLNELDKSDAGRVKERWDRLSLA